MIRYAPNVGAVEGVGKNRSSKIHSGKNLSRRKIASKHKPRLLIHLRNLNLNARDVDADENQGAPTQGAMPEVVPGVLPGQGARALASTADRLT